MARIGGKISMAYDGIVMQTVGAFTVNPGEDKAEMLVGSDRVHGHKSMPQAPYISGEIRWVPGFEILDFLRADDINVTLRLANGQTVSLKGGKNTTEGDINTEEASVPIKVEGTSMEIF